MTEQLLDQLLGDVDAEDVFNDATVRTRFNTAAVRITDADVDPAPEPPETGLEEGEVELQQDDTENEIFDGEDPITDALDAADGGDTILVGPGTFEETVIIETTNISLECVSPEETTIVGRIKIQAASVSIRNFEIVKEDDVDTVVTVTGDTVEIIGCVFVITTTVEAVIKVEDASNVEIDGCEFEADDITVERFIFVAETADTVEIDGCTFVGEVKLEVIVLNADNSSIIDCDFSEIIKTDLEVELIIVSGDGITVRGCVFVITESVERIIVVDEGEDINVEDCEFEADNVTVERFILVRQVAVNVRIVRCVFVGSVSVTTIEHNGGGDSEVRDCEFDDVEPEDEATLIIRIDDVEIVEVDVTLVEIQVDGDVRVFESIQAAVDVADPGDTVFVGPGEYSERVDVRKEIELLGPNSETPGVADRTEEATLSGGNIVTLDNDVTVAGFRFEQSQLIVERQFNSVEIRNNVFEPAQDTALQLFIPDQVTLTGNLIEGSGNGDGVFVSINDFEVTVEISDNVVRNMDTGIEAQAPDGEFFVQPDDPEILAESAAVPIFNNEIQGNNLGVKLAVDDGADPSDSAIGQIHENNTFENNTTDIEPSTESSA